MWVWKSSKFRKYNKNVQKTNIQKYNLQHYKILIFVISRDRWNYIYVLKIGYRYSLFTEIDHGMYNISSM